MVMENLKSVISSAENKKYTINMAKKKKKEKEDIKKT
jgi:hypothetical protein